MKCSKIIIFITLGLIFFKSDTVYGGKLITYKKGDFYDQPYRIFKNSKGDQFRAKAIKYSKFNDTFILKNESGRQISVKRSSLKYFCENDQSYFRWLHSQFEKYGALDPFLSEDKHDAKAQELAYKTFHTRGRWNPKTKECVYREGTKFENRCGCWSHPKLMKLTDITNYKCVLESRTQKWIEAMPYSPEHYKAIFIVRKSSGILYPSMMKHRPRDQKHLWSRVQNPPLANPFFYFYYRITIRLEEGETIKDLSPLLKFPNLEQIYIENCHVEDLSPLKNLKKLITVDLRNNRIKTFNDLLENESLTRLDLEFNDIRYIDRIDEFLKNTRLRNINLDHNPLHPDLSPFESEVKREWDDRFCEIPWCGPNKGKKIHNWMLGFNVKVIHTPIADLFWQKKGVVFDGKSSSKEEYSRVIRKDPYINSFNLCHYDNQHRGWFGLIGGVFNKLERNLNY